MNSKENIQIIGRLESRPQIKELKNGKKIARFKFLSNETKKVNGKLINITRPHNVVAWNKLAEKLESLYSKDIEIIIKGQVVVNTYCERTNKTMRISDVLAESILYRDISQAIEDNKISNQRA